MPNPIKYTTGTESLALKKGNFFIGTGDVGKGPTSNTGYYDGITPPSGGYTIYLNKESNGPSIYTASNDAQLISLTNSIASASYTTVNECLNYYYTQSDKMCVNLDYPNIPTDGLILNFDAGFVGSYPKSGTSWKDLSLTQISSTLNNGPTYSTSGEGSILFDGGNDGVSMSNPFGTSNQPNLTYSIWMYIPANSNTSGAGPDVFESGPGPDTTGPFLWLNASYNGTFFGVTFRADQFVVGTQYYTNGMCPSNAYVSTYWDTWVNVACVFTYGNQNNVKCYINGILDRDFNTPGTVPMTFRNPITVGYGSDGYFKGNIGMLQMWNKSLSSSDMLNIYNSTKSRYGH